MVSTAKGTTATLKHVFNPVMLGRKTLRNRIVFGAHTTNMADNGLPGEQHLAYYLERAKGGAAMITVEPMPDAARTTIPAAFEIPFERRQTGRAKPIVIAAKDAPQQDPDLIAPVADARRWASELLEGRASSIQHITDREGLRSGSVSRILPLAWLAPDISTAILEGRQPPHLTPKTLRAFPELPLEWDEQRRVLGFAQP